MGTDRDRAIGSGGYPILNQATDTIAPGSVYGGRPSPLGNPFAIGPDGRRAEVIQKYASWIEGRLRDRDPVVLTALMSIKPGQALVCHCAPKRCHAEVVAQVLNRADWRPNMAPRGRYAGIGSRGTPVPVLTLMTRLATRLAAHGYTLQSGGAPGADQAFEAGAGTSKAIFLPWPHFQSRRSAPTDHDRPDAEAFRIAATLHPAWARLSSAAQALMARNVHQILGKDLRSPVDFVACWTSDGCESERERSRATGGTGQAIALADRWGIPVINLARPTAMARLAEQVQAWRALSLTASRAPCLRDRDLNTGNPNETW